jgi:hypothetical protein
VNLTNNGTITVTNATLTLTGTTTLGSSSTLGIGVSSQGNGEVAMSGTALLAGNLAIDNASGYTPPAGTTDTVVGAGTLEGTFSSVSGTQLSGEQWNVGYTSTSVTLTAGA